MEYCIDKKTKEKIFAFDIKNEYGIKDFLLEKKLRKMSINEELICPECGTPVILRAGEIKIPHFSHKLKTKNCFFSTYTYNENRIKALKILYDKLKKYKDVKILELTKNFKGYGTIDIFLERGVYKKRKYAIMIKNTIENINKWEKLHIELLKEEITPIYFNYGTTKEINDFQKEISKSFFYRNLMNLTTNHGIRLVDVEEQELYTIATTFYLNENNRLKSYKNILHKNNYKDSIEFIYNSIGRDTYIFLDSEKYNYTKKILEYKKNLTPFLIIDSNREILLVINIDKNITKGEEEFESLEIKYISLSYFMASLPNPNGYMYFYPKSQLFKEKCFYDYYSIEESKEKQLQEFFELSDFDITRIISIEEAGFFKNDIEEFIKNYSEIKNKIFKYDYMSEESYRDFELYKLNNLYNIIKVDTPISNEDIKISKKTFPKIKKNIVSNSLTEVINYFKFKLINFYEIIFNKSELTKIVYTLEDKIFSCNEENKIIKLEQLYDIFKSLLKEEKTNNSNSFRLLFSRKSIRYYEITELFYNMYINDEIIFKHTKTEFLCHKAKILSFFECNEFELNILNTFYKLKNIESNIKIQLKLFNDSLEIYFKNNDFHLFLMNVKRIEKKLLENFLIKNLDIIYKKNMKDLLIFISKNIDLKKSIYEEFEILDYILTKDISPKKYKSFIEKIKFEKNIVLFELILGTEYEKLFSSKDIANILAFNYNSTKRNDIVKKYILKNKENLNVKGKDGLTLFYYLCTIVSDTYLINLCLKNGADLYLKTPNNDTPLIMLERRIKGNYLQNFSLSNKKIEN